MTSAASHLERFPAWRLDGRSLLLGVIAVVTFGGFAEALVAVPAKVMLIVTVRLVIGALAAFLLVFLSMRRREQVAAQRTRLAAIVEGSNDAIIGQTLGGVVTDWNPAAERMFGYRASEAIGRTALGLIVPAELEAEEGALFARVSQGGATPHLQTTRRRRDGAVLDVSITVSPLHAADGRIVGVSKTVRDISASKAAEVALVEAQARLRLTTQASGVGLWDWDRCTGALSMDDTMLALFGRSREDYDGRYETWKTWLHPSDVERAEQLLSKAIARRKPLDVVFRTRTPKGELRHIRTKSSIDFDAADRPVRLLGVSIDITSQKAREAEVEALNASLEQQVAQRTAQLQTLIADAKKAQIRLETLNRTLRARTEEAEAATVAKSQFLANMSHEIRSPMNAILGMLQLLSSTDLSPRQKDYADKAYSATRSLLYLLNDILDFSKIEADKLTLENAVFSVDAMIRDIGTSLAGAVGNKPLELVYDVAADLPPLLRGDVHRLRQVLVNLISNAVKFTERGEVVVSIQGFAAERQRHEISFSVRDTGIGIAPENLSAIFEGFTQAEASTTRRYGGSGLGLAICRRLVALMGGELGIESELGVGSRFHFTLLLESNAGVTDMPGPPRSADAAPGAAGRCRRLAGLRLLVVEDHEMNQQVACELLSSEGAFVELAESGAAGIDRTLAADPPFDAVLMDIQMPAMDGYQAARQILAAAPFSAPPIIAMTANAMASDKTACLAAGMRAHIAKPIDLDLLVTTILGHCGARTPAADPSQSEPLAETGAALDLALARLGGDMALFQCVLTSFARQADSIMEALRACVAAGSTGEASRVLHTLKGDAGTVGLTALADFAASLERDIETTGALDQLDASFHRLGSTLRDGVAMVRSRLAVDRARQEASAFRTVAA